MHAMSLWTVIAFVLFSGISYVFVFRCQSPNAQLDELLSTWPSLECPKNFSLYTLQGAARTYRLQVEECRQCNVRDERLIRKCTTSREADEGNYRKLGDMQEIVVRKACTGKDYNTNNVLLIEDTSKTNSRCTSDDLAVRNAEESPDDEGVLPTITRGIYPGTLWCGWGNLAGEVYGRLGKHSSTDACCRAHDLCRPLIQQFQTRYHYNNKQIVPVSHCSCDVQLYNCFKRVNSSVSKEVGRLFFNIGKVQCFDFEERDVCDLGLFSICLSYKKECGAVLRESPKF